MKPANAIPDWMKPAKELTENDKTHWIIFVKGGAA